MSVNGLLYCYYYVVRVAFFIYELEMEFGAQRWPGLGVCLRCFVWLLLSSSCENCVTMCDGPFIFGTQHVNRTLQSHNMFLFSVTLSTQLCFTLRLSCLGSKVCKYKQLSQVCELVS